MREREVADNLLLRYVLATHYFDGGLKTNI
jgi:hypothetical protein